MAAQVFEFLLAGFTDNSGEPLAAGKVYTYYPGTNNAKATYTDSSAQTLASNPIILDANGRKQIYGVGSYKFVIKDSNDNLLYTFDNIYFDFNFATTPAEISALNSLGSEIVIHTPITMTGNLTITAPIKFLKGGIITTAGYTLTINGPLVASATQIFSAAANNVVLDADSCVRIYPEWWGATGDGTTEDTTPVERAIQVSAASGIPAWFSQDYVVNEADLESGCTIDGFGTLIKKAGTTDYVLACTRSDVYHDIIIRNIKINGNKANCSSGGGIVAAGINILIENCYIYDTPHACINMGYRAGGKNIRLLNNHCLNPGKSGNNWGAIGITGGNNIIVTGNLIESTDGFQGYGIDVEPDSGTPAASIGQIIIANNVIKAGNIQVDGEALSDTLNDVIVHNNIIDKRGGVATGFENEAPLYCRKINGLSIKNNILHNIGVAGTAAIVSIVLSAHNTNFDISDNTCYCLCPNISTFAIRALDTNSYGRIANNFLIQQGSYALTYGIYNFDDTNLDHSFVYGNVGVGTITTLNNVQGNTNSCSTIPLRGATGARPTGGSIAIGQCYIDTTLDADGKPIFWSGLAWVDATGTVV
jgi:hypothetical protein